MKWDQSKFIPAKDVHLSESDAAIALREAWKKIYKIYPSHKSLALLWAQWALESGRGKHCKNFNFGNLKSRFNDGQCWTMFECTEVIKGKEIKYIPPHDECKFRAYLSAIDGAEDYIKFVSQRKRYIKAWEAVLIGDPVKYSHELKIAGYYTASEILYTKGVVRLTSEFLSKVDKLLGDELFMAEFIENANKVKNPNDIFTDEERKQILNKVSNNLNTSLEEYFSSSKRVDEDENEPITLAPSFWTKVKGKIFG